MKREFRIIPKAQIRAKQGDKPGIEGYAAVFNELSEDLGWFREIIMPGAFADCLSKDPDVRCLFNHNSDVVLGRTAAKTLALSEDGTGLHFSADLPDTQTARDLLVSIQRGDISQCSFGFQVRKQKWTEEQGEDAADYQLIRELHAVDVFDVSPVTFPAYPQTSVDKRALWPDGRPLSVRLIPRALARSTRDDEDEENQNGCGCDCTACAEQDDCAGCTNVDCDDSNCQDANCPNQDQDVEENALDLERLRMRARAAAAL